MRAKYVLSEVFLGLWRNISMTVAMIITMAVSLSMLGAALLLYNQVNELEEQYQTDLEVVIYLNRDVDEEVEKQMESDLNQNPLVDKLTYESQEDAWQRFQQTFEDSPELIDSVDASVLPSAFRIKLTDITRADELIDEYADHEDVAQITNQKEVLQNVFNVLDGGQKLSLVLAGVQGLAALMLVANTIQVAAFSRRREVAIMKLVGAPNWFVQAPFVLEAVFAGLIGAFIAFGTLLAAKVFVIDGKFEAVFNLMPNIEWTTILMLLPILAGVAAAISAVTAWITLRFNIRV
ncbi:permease-like cell division protein FtsX [Haloglycomyces albus]|uniref:permease-like cell division protein FtsX n=1 Tax=Haloglycomyces albus TaxID=526067 RepID=UPI00046CD72E|nr:permease-like cell division protein FtsX [Haloglycomyces albus]